MSLGIEGPHGHLSKMERNKHISPGRLSFFHYGHRCSGLDVYQGQSWCQQGTRLSSHGGWGEISAITDSTEYRGHLDREKTYTSKHRHCQHYLYNHPYHPYQGHNQRTEITVLPKSIRKVENADSYLDTVWRYRDSAQNKEAIDEPASRGSGDRPDLDEWVQHCLSFTESLANDSAKRCHSDTDLEIVGIIPQPSTVASESNVGRQSSSFNDCHLSYFKSREPDGLNMAESLEVLYIEALNLSDSDSSGSEADVSHSASTIPALSVSDLRQDINNPEFGSSLDDASLTNDSRFRNNNNQQTSAIDDTYDLTSLLRSL